MAAQGHISIAWPIDLLYTLDGQQGVVGFLMPYVPRMRPLLEYYNPLTRRQQCPLFNYRYLHRTAHNLAAAMRALHARGYVIGDVNESNILVTDTALVTLVDTDSFQVRQSQNGIVYRCPVGKPEFTPPELQGRLFAHLDRAPEHDLFGLAVLIFQLLMEGTHPFAGVFLGHGDPPPYEARIAAGYFSYSRKRHGPYRPMPSAPSSAILHPTLQELFVRCFEDGHRQPCARPDAQTWQRALQEAENALVSCSVNDQHLYSNHLGSCPWCARTVRLKGRDPFPSRPAVQRRQHLQSTTSPQTPLAPSGAPTAPPSPPRPMSMAGQSTTTPPSPRPMPAAASPASRRPSRLSSALTGTLWGTVSGALLGALIHVALDPSIAQDPIPLILLGALWRVGWGAVWGAVWGTMWGACRLPTTSGISGRFRDIITGAILGACLGIMTSAMVDGTPGSLMDTSWNTFLEALLNVQWHAILPMAQDILLECIRRVRLHAIPGTVVGTILGIIWGACGR